ncbi:ABC transporter permease [Metabacillus idriensis]|uniref:ABC transporter permease n=1 Tax=Metabacillus idriensis TaxID=324768 RepID=UPI00174EC8E7|nr:ABC transporter permease [Metabacillus idriensis]
MLDLMKLELKKINIRTYINSTIVISIILLGLIYMIAFIPRVETNDPNIHIFSGYKNIITLFGILNMTVFCILASVMYSRFVIEEYKGNRAILLFSYPIRRSKIFISKVMIVSIFTIISMSISNIIIYFIFGVSETFLPLVNDSITFEVIAKSIMTTIIMAATAVGLSIISMGIGFIYKSVPTTIVSAILFCSLFSNISGALRSITLSTIFMSIAIIAAIFVARNVMKKINLMEV